MTLIPRAGILFPVLLLFLVFRGAGQQPGDSLKAVDTVQADTVVVGADASTGFGSNIDTSNLTGVNDTHKEDSAVLRSVSDSIAASWKKNRRFGYANDPAYWRHTRQDPHSSSDWLWRFLTSAGFRYFIYILLAGILIFVIVRIMSDNNFGLFYRRKQAKAPGDEGKAEEQMAEEDLDVSLEQALAAGDHRRATRYLYLRTLRLLDERGLIRLTHGATNHDYAQQLAGKPQDAPFRFLTLAYEKVWYGDFLPGDAQFQRLHRHFTDFDKTVRL